jgi:hypothetical protein
MSLTQTLSLIRNFDGIQTPHQTVVVGDKSGAESADGVAGVAGATCHMFLLRRPSPPASGGPGRRAAEERVVDVRSRAGRSFDFTCISSVSDGGLVQGSGLPSASMRARKRVTRPRLIPVGDAGTVPEMYSVSPSDRRLSPLEGQEDRRHGRTPRSAARCHLPHSPPS